MSFFRRQRLLDIFDTPERCHVFNPALFVLLQNRHFNNVNVTINIPPFPFIFMTSGALVVRPGQSIYLINYD